MKKMDNITGREAATPDKPTCPNLPESFTDTDSPATVITLKEKDRANLGRLGSVADLLRDLNNQEHDDDVPDNKLYLRHVRNMEITAIQDVLSRSKDPVFEYCSFYALQNIVLH